MKKLLLLFTLVLSVAASGIAQNANRSGVFIEVGTGFLVGSVPYSKVAWKDNILITHKPEGLDVNFAIGYRRATSPVFAWSIKAEISAVPQFFNPTFVWGVMPGIRFTTKEIFGNTSLYFGFDVGFAMGYAQSLYLPSESYNINKDYVYDLTSDTYHASGAKFSVSAGFNITTFFYVGLYCDYNVLSNQVYSLNKLQYEDQTRQTSNWGSLGVRVGYRF